jgi:transcriptional regulator with XRE-family HTH domain
MDRVWLGQNIKRLRKARKWTQKDLYNRSGVSERTIQEIEAAKANPSLSNIESIEGALETELIVANDPNRIASELAVLKAEVNFLREQNQALHAGNALISKLLNLPPEIQLFVQAVVEKNPRPKGLPDTLGKVLQALILRLK